MEALFSWVNNLAPLRKRKDAGTAAGVGTLFGCIGLGIYLESFTDFIIPLLVFILLTILIPGVGAVPGWLFAGLYGYFRVVNSNARLTSDWE